MPRLGAPQLFVIACRYVVWLAAVNDDGQYSVCSLPSSESLIGGLQSSCAGIVIPCTSPPSPPAPMCTGYDDALFIEWESPHVPSKYVSFSCFVDVVSHCMGTQ
jgi:hypothetical protein